MVGSELKMRGTIGAKFGKEVWNQFVQLCEDARYGTVDRYTRLQCCGTVTIFTVPVPTFDRFRFRFQLLTNYGFGSDSVSRQ